MILKTVRRYRDASLRSMPDRPARRSWTAAEAVLVVDETDQQTKNWMN